MQDGLEAALAATAERVDLAVRASAAAVRELKKASVAAATGSVRDLRRSLEASEVAARELVGAAKAAAASFDFDEGEHLASGGYVRELLELALNQGVAMFEEDGQLLCYPSLLRVLPGDAAVEIDRRRDRRLRPSVVLAALAAMQNRPLRFRAEPFLESLALAYGLLARQTAEVVRLDAVWGVLTLLPGQAREYTKPEFARDLYLLDQSEVAQTRAGQRMRWHASTGTRSTGALTTVARSGQQQRYWGVSFSPA